MPAVHGHNYATTTDAHRIDVNTADESDDRCLSMVPFPPPDNVDRKGHRPKWKLVAATTVVVGTMIHHYWFWEDEG